MHDNACTTRCAKKSRIIKLNRLSVNARNNIFNCKRLKMLKVHPTRHIDMDLRPDIILFSELAHGINHGDPRASTTA
jgi:hypothetical protein